MTPRKEDAHEIPVEITDAEEAPRETPETAQGTDLPPAPGSGGAGDDRTYEEAVDHLRRLQAEFTNYKRRVERERLDSLAWGQRLLVEKVLPVLDDFDRAVASVEGDKSPAAEGLTLIRDKLVRVLTEAGLERIEAEGQPFDPDIHEALMTQPVEADRVGTVLMELVPGFMWKGRLVRPSRVQVGIEGEEN